MAKNLRIIIGSKAPKITLGSRMKIKRKGGSPRPNRDTKIKNIV